MKLKSTEKFWDEWKASIVKVGKAESKLASAQDIFNNATIAAKKAWAEQDEAEKKLQEAIVNSKNMPLDMLETYTCEVCNIEYYKEEPCPEHN